MTIFGVILILACTPTALLDFAIPNWKADKNFRVEDAYKWLFQATRGGEHAAPDRASAKKWLDDEWSSMWAGPANEKLWEPLCKDHSIVRANLRPYKDHGGGRDDVVDALVASARFFNSSEANFRAAWAMLGKRLGKRPVGSITLAEWQRLDDTARAAGYPAVHHSSTYDEAEHPAYRIVTRAEMVNLLSKLHGYHGELP